MTEITSAEVEARPLCLNIGGGDIRFPGFTNVDLYPVAEGDIQCDLLSLTSKFAPDSVDEIRMDHILEHLPYRQCATALLECWTVLRPGGRIRIGVPDMMGVAALWLAQADQQPTVALANKAMIVRHIYGSQTAEGQYHQSGWDRPMLIDLLAACGFGDVTAHDDTERGDTIASFYCTAYKEDR